MGIEVFDISLSTPPTQIYRPGDIVCGSIKLVATPDTEISEGISVILYGYALAQWDESTGKSTTVYNGHEELFKQCINIPVQLQQNDYLFMLRIPNIPTLPWTTETLYGRVQYGVNAIIKMPWYKLGDQKAKLQFRLQSEVHPRLVPFSRRQTYYNDTVTEHTGEDSAGCCCIPFCCWYYCSDEKVKVTLKVQSLWNFPGEDLDFTLEIDNTLSKRTVGKAMIILTGSWCHTAKMSGAMVDEDARTKYEEKVFAEDLHVIKVDPRDVVTSNGTLKLPYDLPPTQVESDVLTLTYKLKVVMQEISGFRCVGTSVTAEVDVVIGSRK